MTRRFALGCGLLLLAPRRAEAGVYRAYPLRFPLLIAFPLLILVLMWTGPTP